MAPTVARATCPDELDSSGSARKGARRAGYGVDGFFREAAVPVVPGQARPEPTEPDPERLARLMARYGIDTVGPPPTLD